MADMNEEHIRYLYSNIEDLKHDRDYYRDAYHQSIQDIDALKEELLYYRAAALQNHIPVYSTINSTIRKEGI